MTHERAPMRVMIAVDHSLNSEYAFHETMKTFDKERDLLFIISVSQTITNLAVTGLSAPVMYDAQRQADAKMHTLLVHYVHLCKRAGVKNFKTFLGTGTHSGEVICRAAEEKYIDVLIVGRRGISRLKRLFMGSTSRYCVEHAPCTVTCYKLPPNMETLTETTVTFSDDVHKVSKETFVHSPHPFHASTPSSTDTTADHPLQMEVGGIPPMIERYDHPLV